MKNELFIEKVVILSIMKPMIDIREKFVSGRKKLV